MHLEDIDPDFKLDSQYDSLYADSQKINDPNFMKERK